MLGVGALIGAAFMASGRPREAANGDGGQTLRIAQAGQAPAAAPFLANLAATGQHIESAELRDGKILVRLSGPRGEELVVLDAATGAIAGRVVLAPSP